MPRPSSPLLEQLELIAEGLGRTLAPFCEVVVHDLRDPAHAIVSIHNNLSGRAPGEPATELGLARIADPAYPPLLVNYANRFADGRPAKSTSIGIRDAQGRYAAALCLNVDLTLFKALHSAMGQFAQVDAEASPPESLDPAGADAIRTRIDAYAARLGTTPRALKAEARRALLQQLRADGLLQLRHAMQTVAGHLGVSRATVYNDAR